VDCSSAEFCFTSFSCCSAHLQSKPDLAQDLCRKTLLENKSCSQAWEILGLVFEKESKYELAADSYEKVRTRSFPPFLLSCSPWGSERIVFSYPLYSRLFLSRI
jgi:lipopolysaccharide biosynthesis regulator YciM